MDYVKSDTRSQKVEKFLITFQASITVVGFLLAMREPVPGD